MHLRQPAQSDRPSTLLCCIAPFRSYAHMLVPWLCRPCSATAVQRLSIWARRRLTSSTSAKSTDFGKGNDGSVRVQRHGHPCKRADAFVPTTSCDWLSRGVNLHDRRMKSVGNCSRCNPAGSTRACARPADQRVLSLMASRLSVPVSSHGVSPVVLCTIDDGSKSPTSQRTHTHSEAV